MDPIDSDVPCSRERNVDACVYSSGVINRSLDKKSDVTKVNSGIKTDSEMNIEDKLLDILIH